MPGLQACCTAYKPDAWPLRPAAAEPIQPIQLTTRTCQPNLPLQASRHLRQPALVPAAAMQQLPANYCGRQQHTARPAAQQRGTAGYATDSESLAELEAKLLQQGEVADNAMVSRKHAGQCTLFTQYAEPTVL